MDQYKQSEDSTLMEVAEQNARLANSRAAIIVELKSMVKKLQAQIERSQTSLMRYEDLHDRDPKRQQLFGELKRNLFVEKES